MRYRSFETALSEDYGESLGDRVLIVDNKHSGPELSIEGLIHWGNLSMQRSRSMWRALSPEWVIPSPEYRRSSAAGAGRLVLHWLARTEGAGAGTLTETWRQPLRAATSDL